MSAILTSAFVAGSALVASIALAVSDWAAPWLF